MANISPKGGDNRFESEFAAKQFHTGIAEKGNHVRLRETVR